ncbi:hypothetical protein VCSRO84_3210 [Vibrio cholerae]|nr:hypothetical protein VCSRO84_3210 [Vibrio cholerae]
MVAVVVFEFVVMRCQPLRRALKNPTALLNEADGAAIAILNHNKPAAYLVPAETYEYLIDMLEDYELSQIVDSRRADLSQAVEVNIDDL